MKRYTSSNLLYPPFLKQMEAGLERCRKAGFEMYPFETYRSIARQFNLYTQGRTTPGAIVTYSKPGDSWHHYGVAMDIALKKDGKWSWDFDPKKISEFFPDVKWGGVKDGPHYNLAKLPPLETVKSLVNEGGILGFWSFLDQG